MSHESKGSPPRGVEDPTPLEIETRVKRLTSLAEDLFRRGSCEAAFESLMKAYFLDPVSPQVFECEQHLLPALEIMRRRGSLHQADLTGSAENFQLATLLVQRMDHTLRNGMDQHDSHTTAAEGPPADPAKTAQQERIILMKQKHEQLKKEREQQIWRSASSPPKVNPPAGKSSSASKPQRPGSPADVTIPPDKQGNSPV